MSNAPGSARILSIDAYRGFVMFLMLAEVLCLPQIAVHFPDSAIWQFLSFHNSHVEWAGCSLHDLIQPSFSFLVGVALPFSLVSRAEKGQSTARMTLHAVWRAGFLTWLGIFLRSMGRPQTNFDFTDTLSQIGLGYLPLFAIGVCPRRWHWVALVCILVAYWGAFALYPLPPTDFDYVAQGVPANWPEHYQGFAAHWNKNSNLAWRVDRWFLNLLPRQQLYTYDGGGYTTLNFIPTLATMVLGLIAGGWLRNLTPPKRNVQHLITTGILCLLIGYALDTAGICPSVKRIWTPSWVLVSGGWCFLLLSAFYCVIDLAQWTSWSYPLRVIGANSIVAYLMAHVSHGFVIDSLRIHLGADFFRIAGDSLTPLLTGVAVLAIDWLVLWWMYRKKIFVRV